MRRRNHSRLELELRRIRERLDAQANAEWHAIRQARLGGVIAVQLMVLLPRAPAGRRIGAPEPAGVGKAPDTLPPAEAPAMKL